MPHLTSTPSRAFPLSRHRNGQWYVTRRINGRKRFFYFGRYAEDADGRRALAEYQAVADDLAAGREPGARASPPDLITAGELAGRYLDFMEARAKRQEISYREFDDVRRACLYDFLDTVTEDAPAARLATSEAGGRPLDRLRGTLCDRLGVAAVNKRLSKIRGMLRWGFRQKLVAAPLYEDEALRAMPRRLARRERRRREAAHGPAIFTPDECRRLVAAASVESASLLAFVLLGLNGGLGQSHISALPLDPPAVDVEGGFIDWIRTKTEERCQVPLWPVTAHAMRLALATRPRPVPEAEGLFFVTRFGNPWVAELVKTDASGAIGDVNPDDAIGKAFDRLQRELGIKRPGRGFYGLRRTFSTIANEIQDRDATRRIMGHGLEGMDQHYVRAIDRQRLEAVTSHVGRRLLGCVDLAAPWPAAQKGEADASTHQHLQ